MKYSFANENTIVDIVSVPMVGTNEEVTGYVADAVLDFYKSFGFTTCRETIKAKGFDISKDEFIETIVPAVLDDYKAHLWDSTIHRSEDRERLEKVCGMIYDEE